MAINYTTLLGLAQPVTGTEANTWGTVVNDEITALLDSAIAGAATFSVTSGNVTLTSVDGAADQARMAILIATGTPGTTRNIVAPSQSKTYIVVNQSDASVVLKGSATTGVTIRAGQAATCVWNGADFESVASGDVDGPSTATNTAVAIFDGTTGKLLKNTGVTIDGSNNVSGVVQLNATTVDATNIEVTNLKAKDGTAAGSIADSTGVVTLTNLAGTTANITTVNATTVDTTNLEVTNLKAKDGTAAGSIADSTGIVTLASSVLTTTDINGGTIDGTTIGGSTAAAGTFTSLTDSGNLTFTGTGNRILGDFSSAPASRVTFQSSTLNGATQVRAIPNGSGTTATLQVGNTSDPANQSVLTMNIDGSTANLTSFFNGTGTTLPLTFNTGGSERVRIDTSGNLGIGTNSPKTLLQISGAADTPAPTLGAATGGSLYLTNTSTAYGLLFGTSDSGSSWLQAQRTDGVATAYGINLNPSGGNVGIAVDPSVKFEIEGGNDANVMVLRTGAQSGSAIFYTVNNNAGVGQYFLGHSTADVNTGNLRDGNLNLYTNSTEKMRITSGGEVYIAGTTDQGAYNLQCNGTGVWGAGAYVNGSDRNLKDNITPLGSCLDVVAALKPVTYQYKEEYSKDQSVQPGFIAQDLQDAMAGKEYLEGIVQAGPNHLNVAYQNLIPILTKALQEQQALIQDLTTRLTALEGN